MFTLSLHFDAKSGTRTSFWKCCCCRFLLFSDCILIIMKVYESMGLFTKEWIKFRKPFRIVILTLSWFKSLILPFVNTKLFQMRLLKCKKGCFGSWSAKKPDSEHLWMQSSFGTWFVHAHFGNARWSHAWVKGSIGAVGTKYWLSVRRSCSWSGRWLQCLWMHVVRLHEPNQEADRDPKRLSERDSLLCEQAQWV